MNLFIQCDSTPPVSTDFEKNAAEVDLPEDPNAWPQEILNELYVQVPYLADFQPHVEMKKVDAEKGYGFGHVEVSNQTEAQNDAEPQQLSNAGIRHVRIPVIVREGKLQPFDLIVTDKGAVLPLTESRLRQAIFRPQAFDVTSLTPGDQSMIGMLYPPYRQNMGFGGGGMTVPADGMGKSGSESEKTASVLEEYLIKELESKDAGFRRPGKEKSAAAKTCPKCGKTMEKCSCAKMASIAFREKGSILKDIAPTINATDLNSFWGTVEKDYGIQAQFKKNAGATMGALGLLAQVNPGSAEKTASAIPTFLKPTVTQVAKIWDDTYAVKTANHHYWQPTSIQCTRAELVAQYGEKTAADVDAAGAVTQAEPTAVQAMPEAPPNLESVSHPGTYKVIDIDGKELLGAVIPNLIDTDGEPLPLALFTNGSVSAVQGEIFGEHAGEAGKLPTADPNGFGAFFSPDAEVKMLIPMTVSSSHAVPGEPAVFSGETYDGRPVEVSLQPNVATAVPTGDGRVLLPENWQWTPLKEQTVKLLGDEDAKVHAEAATAQKTAQVVVRASKDSFSIHGEPVLKLAYAERELVGLDQAMFILAALGVDQEHGVKKLASAIAGARPETIACSRSITPASEARTDMLKAAQARMAELPNLRVSLIKEAAALPDPTTVDTVLSLGFINPENVMTFVSYLPQIDGVQGKLCDLLLAARLGLQNVSSSGLERAIRSVEECLEGLKAIAFAQEG